MINLTRSFYLFVTLHSFLIGLLPVFIAVILWKKGLMLSDIAFFIALTASGFIIALFLWDRLRAAGQWSKIVALSFLFEIALVALLLWDFFPFLLSFAALINGAAACFYWSTQRVLFQRIMPKSDTGNSFANFQILVMVTLKIGILLGSFLLAKSQMSNVLVVFIAISTFGYYILKQSLVAQLVQLDSQQPQPKALSVRQIVSFKDTFHSTGIFLVDGVFLFLESYFWVLSLYLLTQQNILKLGGLIVLLSLLLACLFFIIKKYIDEVHVQRVFIISIIGYAFSWWLRGQLSIEDESLFLYSGILLIAFLSSFFRLAFNKRFYELASLRQPVRYIICKSYYSQFALVLFFSFIGYVFKSNTAQLQQLQSLYMLIIPLVFVYLFYGWQHNQQNTKAY